MLHRFWTTLAVASICFCASPAVPDAASPLLDEPELKFDDSPLPDDAAFAEAARTDPILMLRLAAKRYKLKKAEGDKEVITGYAATFVKQERIDDKLHPVEVIRVRFRDEPYAVQMHWDQGARGLADATLFVSGDHGGKMLARGKLLGRINEIDPHGRLARSSSRYAIDEFGFFTSTKRSLKVWSAVAARGSLDWHYDGTRIVSETGGRECHIVRRICAVDELDPFAAGEANPHVTDENRADSFRSVTLYFDAHTWLQVGTEHHRANGEPVSSYFFRDVVLNPPLPSEAFTKAALKK